MTLLSVLVVEDDAMIGILLAEMLEAMGYTVCAIAATEDQAVADAARYKPGLIIVDEILREGSGLAAADRIRLAGPLPCVFISGAPSYGGRQGAHVLQKPFHEADLAREIKFAIRPPAFPATLGGLLRH